MFYREKTNTFIKNSMEKSTSPYTLKTSHNFNHNSWKENYSSPRKTVHIFKKWLLQNKVIQYITRPWHPLMKNSIQLDIKYLLTGLICLTDKLQLLIMVLIAPFGYGSLPISWHKWVWDKYGDSDDSPLESANTNHCFHTENSTKHRKLNCAHNSK